ncbi:MAG: hypothetical protein RLY16_943, partial [Bacteroidota bacterium]
MKIIAFLIVAFCWPLKHFGQQIYWQQDLDYTIKASLDEKAKTITGFESIIYKNNSPQTLTFIWFHIWPNAYKNDKTALIKQLKADADRGKKMESYGEGSIEDLAFTVDGVTAKTEAHSNPDNIDIIKVLLNKPLAPGQKVTIATPFTVKLPPYFSRSGYADGEFMACQWYPKPAVFDKLGWHEFPYLDMGEFYSEYANYTVVLTVPNSYVVGATGQLQTPDEVAKYKELGKLNAANRNGKPALYEPANPNGFKTLSYSATGVPDFAWFAEKNFVIQYDTLALPNGKVIDAFTYYHNKKETIWNNSIDYVKSGTRKYSEWIGN